MRIGVDFDNTIVCYDGLFHRVALERGLIDASVGTSKQEVRDHLRAVGREDDWTEMQGYVYGPGLVGADAFPGIREFFRDTIAAGIDVFIVSHKTRHPYRGPKYDLHEAARNWLEVKGFFDPEDVGLSRERAFFEVTLEEKLGRVASLGCTHFVDDLPEVLAESFFPAATRPLLFDPRSAHDDESRFAKLHAWDGALQLLRAA